MKTFITTLLALFIVYNAQAEGCLPEGITFSSQNQINNFRTAYPGCTQIEGDVIISGSNIVNLNGLNVLTSVGGNLVIQSNTLLTSLSGLENVTSIGGDFYLQGNMLITNLNGLNNLTYAGGDMVIINNPSLITLSGIQGLTAVHGMLWIDDNVSLQNLEGLNNITLVDGLLRISANQVLPSLDGLSSLQTINGSLVIGGQGHLGGIGNPALMDLTGLSMLSTIGGSLEVEYNSSLVTLAGLDNINPSTINGLSVYKNSSLSECEVASICNYIANPSGQIFISDNMTGCNSIEEVTIACLLISADDNPKELQVNLYPVPVRDILTVETDGIKSPVVLTVMNPRGQILSRMTSGTNVANCDFSGFSAGVYFLKIETSQSSGTFKIVKL